MCTPKAVRPPSSTAFCAGNRKWALSEKQGWKAWLIFLVTVYWDVAIPGLNVLLNSLLIKIFPLSWASLNSFLLPPDELWLSHVINRWQAPNIAPWKQKIPFFMFHFASLTKIPLVFSSQSPLGNMLQPWSSFATWATCSCFELCLSQVQVIFLTLSSVPLGTPPSLSLAGLLVLSPVQVFAFF